MQFTGADETGWILYASVPASFGQLGFSFWNWQECCSWTHRWCRFVNACLARHRRSCPSKPILSCLLTACIAAEALQVPVWIIASDFYLMMLARPRFDTWNTLSRNEERCARACEIGLRVTLAVKGDGRPASVLPRSSRPSGNVREWRAHVRAPALAKQIATNFNCLCIHLLTPNALQPHPPILLSSPAQMKEREAGDGAREEAGIITYFSGPL